MNREIKFRAWGGYTDDDGDETRYFVYFGIDNVRNEWIENFEEHPKGGTLLHDKKNVIAIQQFTGLHDKNGKEIYEGDVLCVEDEIVADVIGGFERSEPNNHIVAVDFGPQGSFGTNLGHFHQMLDEYGDSKKYWEIIGNIYENPDFLK